MTRTSRRDRPALLFPVPAHGAPLSNESVALNAVFEEVAELLESIGLAT